MVYYMMKDITWTITAFHSTLQNSMYTYVFKYNVVKRYGFDDYICVFVLNQKWNNSTDYVIFLHVLI